jgi:hypothetical protein
MADHVPFVNTTKDVTFAREYYADSEICRVSLELLNKGGMRPAGKLWIDAGIDGFAQNDPNPQWRAFVDTLDGADTFAQDCLNPAKAVVDSLVNSVMDACQRERPHWISVPQLPYSRDSSRNKVNRLLAASAGAWKQKRNFQGVLILPVILSHQEQTKNRTEWRPRIDLAKSCFERANASGYWVTDCDLSDQAGIGTFESKRFPGIVGFCEDLRAALGDGGPSIAGPFWGLNMLLWAKGLARYPAIGLGNAYRYNLPGGRQMQGSLRVALPPLRRWAVISPQLRTWLNQAVVKTPPAESVHAQFQSLLSDFERLQIADRARRQIAKFYKGWFDSIAGTPPHGRPLALYQDLSAAYVLGKSLPDLPKKEGSARRPERIARQLMVNCL